MHYPTKGIIARVDGRAAGKACSQGTHKRCSQEVLTRCSEVLKDVLTRGAHNFEQSCTATSSYNLVARIAILNFGSDVLTRSCTMYRAPRSLAKFAGVLLRWLVLTFEVRASFRVWGLGFFQSYHERSRPARNLESRFAQQGCGGSWRLSSERET